MEKISPTPLTTYLPQTHMDTGMHTRVCAHFYLSAVLCSGGGGVHFLHMREMFYCCFLYSYRSQLKLVRLKVSESGVYTFLTSNGDASIHLTFEVHVLSKFLRNNYKVMLCERNQLHVASASVNHVTHSSVLLCC